MMNSILAILIVAFLYMYSVSKNLNAELEPLSSVEALGDVLAALISRTCNFLVIYFLFKIIGIVR